MGNPVYVYLIQKGYGSIKIGVSSNPERRLMELQVGNHGDLHIIAKFPFQTRAYALSMEKDLHNKFKRFCLSGEWFKKGILREFKNRAQLFPHIFKSQPSESFNSYHSAERQGDLLPSDHHFLRTQVMVK